MSKYTYNPIILQVSNAQPGQRVSVEISPNGVPIAWSMGGEFHRASGINVCSLSGAALPLGQLSVTPSEVAILTSSNGGSGSLTVSLEAYLVAEAGISTFYLRSSSDPGIEITAFIANASPVVVNQTPTLFSFWQT